MPQRRDPEGVIVREWDDAIGQMLEFCRCRCHGVVMDYGPDGGLGPYFLARHVEIDIPDESLVACRGCASHHVRPPLVSTPSRKKMHPGG